MCNSTIGLKSIRRSHPIKRQSRYETVRIFFSIEIKWEITMLYVDTLRFCLIKCQLGGFAFFMILLFGFNSAVIC